VQYFEYSIYLSVSHIVMAQSTCAVVLQILVLKTVVLHLPIYGIYFLFIELQKRV